MWRTQTKLHSCEAPYLGFVLQVHSKWVFLSDRKPLEQTTQGTKSQMKWMKRLINHSIGTVHLKVSTLKVCGSSAGGYTQVSFVSWTTEKNHAIDAMQKESATETKKGEEEKTTVEEEKPKVPMKGVQVLPGMLPTRVQKESHPGLSFCLTLFSVDPIDFYNHNLFVDFSQWLSLQRVIHRVQGVLREEDHQHLCQEWLEKGKVVKSMWMSFPKLLNLLAKLQNWISVVSDKREKAFCDELHFIHSIGQPIGKDVIKLCNALKRSSGVTELGLNSLSPPWIVVSLMCFLSLLCFCSGVSIDFEGITALSSVLPSMRTLSSLSLGGLKNESSSRFLLNLPA